ncbi:hypothetical protein C731_0443 [Mycolicibacterium hassiacum DSM 44199]|uniref:Uncharacterized protein n=1 Tax=Mycolicibacterium hassiacum (strain DSM 44199 / CIP 105218 / JCM 12690 / 3849) TaxID=1122247 RepID=K5BKU7_MYCHD|nr:hypothetical protein C731_0443 [Mycolicibacterium hassiacum DSM 44199]
MLLPGERMFTTGSPSPIPLPQNRFTRRAACRVFAHSEQKPGT